MKNNLKTLVLALVVAFVSCSEDSESNNNENDQTNEALENTPLQANDIADNVLIEGGAKNDGTPPTPNEGISLDVSNSNKFGLLDEGFEISISSDGAITGAYLQFKSNDGSMADSYFDIDLNANASNKKAQRVHKKRLQSAAKNDDTTLGVGFNANIEPGTFCYEICVYDADGNISAPQEVCVTVESWGGNDAVVGKWEFEKWFYDYDEATVYLPGVDICDVTEGPFFCENIQFELKRESCQNQEYFELQLNADGTYIEREKQNLSTEILEILSPQGTELSQFEQACPDSSVLSEYEYTYESTGRWAYVDAEDKFVFIEYQYEEVNDQEVYSETADPGDGFIYYGFGGYDGEVTLEGDKLVIASYEERTVYFIKE